MRCKRGHSGAGPDKRLCGRVMLWTLMGLVSRLFHTFRREILLIDSGRRVRNWNDYDT